MLPGGRGSTRAGSEEWSHPSQAQETAANANAAAAWHGFDRVSTLIEDQQ
jgi:hypothetical protein